MEPRPADAHQAHEQTDSTPLSLDAHRVPAFFLGATR